MILEDYGWDSWFDDQYKSLNMHLKAGRILGNSGVYKVVCEDGVIEAEISQRLIYSTASDLELPVAGDWVLIISDDSNSGYSIYDLLPRRSLLVLPDDESPDEQIPAAANVDYILAAIPADNIPDMSIVEKLTEISCDWGAVPLFICYGKVDGKDGVESFKKAAGEYETIFIESIDNSGLSKLVSALTPRKTYAVTGINASDVSAIISSLTDGEVFKSEEEMNKGNGALHLLPSSAIILAVPLPLENGIITDDYENDYGDDFDDIIEIAGLCRFNDCHHVNEPGCAVLDALDNGELDYDNYKAYMKFLKKESSKISLAEQVEVKKTRKSASQKEKGAGE